MPTKESYIIENMLMIADKEGNDVPFKLNHAQADLDENFTGRDIVPKARQEGISSYFLARFTVRCLSKRNTRAVVISHESEATQRMLNKVKYYLENLVGGVKPVTGGYSKNEITFPKTNSMFYIGTAGAKKFGRGDTITDLHCSEVAFWDNPKELTAGLFQAVPRSGSIGIESTGYGVGNWYHQRCMRAASGIGRYKLHFYPWQTFPEYCVDLTDEEVHTVMSNLNPEWEECEWKDDDGVWHPGVVEQYNLTPGQVQFRREKLEELDYDLSLFKQEYPMELHECFQASGAGIFQRVNFIETKLWQRKTTEFWCLEGHPKLDRTYIAGVDVGAGTGGDNSVMEIFDLETLEQVAEVVTNRKEPDQFGYMVCKFGRMFNNAFITVESNNHGLTTIAAMRDGKRTEGGAWLCEPYPNYLMYRKPQVTRVAKEQADLLAMFGFNTNRKSKPFIIGKLRRLLPVQMCIHSPMLNEELQTYKELPDGSMGADEGCKDDRVMATAVCMATVEKRIMTLNNSKPYVPQGNDPFLLDSIIKECHKRGSGALLIPSHTL